jgi:hypothetical protein
MGMTARGGNQHLDSFLKYREHNLNKKNAFLFFPSRLILFPFPVQNSQLNALSPMAA